MEVTFHGIHPCPLELSSYLEASFSCVPVEQLTPHQCSYEQYITVNPPSGYIWSDAPDATCPWRVEVEPGQRVNLTLYDFVHPDKDDHRARAVCKKYAQVREGHKESTRHGDGTSICGGAGEGRIRHVYMSDTHEVEIQLSAFRPGDENKPRFLIKYEAVDCPTLKLPLGAEAKRTGDTLAVWCSNNKRWSLRCQGTAWEGTMDTCDADPTPGPSVLNVLSTNWSSPYGLFLIIGAALIIGILIGVCCLGVCVCVRRRKRREREAVAYREHERYNAHPACRRPFKNGPQQPNALAALHPLTEPIPPMSEQEEDYDKPYYANGTVPSWMGYRPLPVPTYEDIMFTQDRASRSPMPPGQDPRFSASEETWFNIPHHREFDPQFNTTGRMGRSKRGLKVGLDGHSRPAPAPPQYFEYDPANREYEKPQPYRRDEQDTPTRKYTKKRKQSSGDVDPDGDETQKKGNNTM